MRDEGHLIRAISDDHLACEACHRLLAQDLWRRAADDGDCQTRRLLEIVGQGIEQLLQVDRQEHDISNGCCRDHAREGGTALELIPHSRAART